MNEIFIKDKNCLERELRINTYEVIPMNKKLGLLEWAPNTVPLKHLIATEYQRKTGEDFADMQA